MERTRNRAWGQFVLSDSRRGLASLRCALALVLHVIGKGAPAAPYECCQPGQGGRRGTRRLYAAPAGVRVMQITLRPNSDFLPVAAVHGGAHLAPFEQRLWDSYQLNMLTGGKFVRNSLIIESPGVSPRDDLQNPTGC